MMSAQLIKDVSDVAAYRAAEEGREPLSIWGPRDATHIPFLGDYTPVGWRRALWSDFYTTPAWATRGAKTRKSTSWWTAQAPVLPTSPR